MAISDFVKSLTKSSLLAHLKNVDQKTMKWRKDLLDAVVTKDEMQDWAGGGGVDHGELGGLTDDDHTQYILAAGTRALTGDWDAGSFEIRAKTLESDVATGTPPLTIASTTKVANLNVDSLDDQSGAYYLDSANFTGTNWTDLTDGGATTLHKHDHGGQDGLLDNDHTQYVLRTQWLQNGFLDASNVSLSWSNANRKLTVAAKVTSTVYLQEGLPYTLLAAGKTSDAIADTEGLYVFYIDAETLTSAFNPSHVDVEEVIEHKVVVAYVYWDATNNLGKLMDELHGASMAPATHRLIHEGFGTIYGDGLGLTDFVVNDSGDVDTHAQFGVTGGEIYDDDRDHDVDTVGPTVGLEIFYLTGTAVRWTTNSGFSIRTAGTGRAAYNNAGAQAEANNSSFVLCHVFATNIKNADGTDYGPICWQGQAQYATVAAARAAAYSEITTIKTGTWPMPEAMPVATVIFQTANAYDNAVKSRVRSTDTGDDYIDWRNATISGGGASAIDHGSLGGLADDDHTQYILAAGTRTLSGDWDAGTYEIRANTFESDVAAGTAPFTVASGTLVTNLNADLLDGTHIESITMFPDPEPTKNDIIAWNSGIISASAGTVTTANILSCSGEIISGNIPVFGTILIPPPYYLLEDSGYAPAAFAVAAHTHADYINKNGTVALTANWDAGSYEVRAETLESDVATGTAPLTIASTTVCTNLNADLLDGNHASVFATVSSPVLKMTVKNSTGSNMTALDLVYVNGVSSGVPTVALTDADAASSSKGMLLILSENINNGSTGAGIFFGYVSGLSGLTAGAIQYIHTTAGDLTESAPSASGDIVRVVGYAISATEMMMIPDGTWIEKV